MITTPRVGPAAAAARIVQALEQAEAALERAEREAQDLAAHVDLAEVCFARYNGLENYRRQFAREGVSSVGALAVVGAESDVEKQLRHLADLGVTDLWPVPFPVGSADKRRTRELLATL